MGDRSRGFEDSRRVVGSLPGVHTDGPAGSNIPDDFTIPACTLTDVDRALFELFDKKLGFQVTVKGGKSIRVPVVFAGGERVFLVKRNRPVRDRNGTLILPVISIRRTSIEQSQLGVIPGRGMGVDTGDIIIKRKLDSSDPAYQNLINKNRLRNQDNVASDANEAQSQSPEGSLPGRVNSRRARGTSLNASTGELLRDDLGDNIFEIITVDFPHFYTAFYEITFWTQYTQHMNQMISRFMTQYDAQGNDFRIDTPKGYWFVAYTQDDWNSGDNFQEYTDQERMVRYTFNMRVPAYLIAPDGPGEESVLRRYLSAPRVSFGLCEGDIANVQLESPVGSGDESKFILGDVNILDRQGNHVLNDRQRVDLVRNVVRNPFTGKNEVQFLRVLDRDQRRGETVVSARNVVDLGDINL